VFKSLFLLLSVAFLAAAASLFSGGEWWGDIREDFRYEARADIASLKEDMRAVRNEVEWAPFALRRLWEDVSRDLGTLEADAAADARSAAQRLSALVHAT
jgi:hypothetical protein